MIRRIVLIVPIALLSLLVFADEKPSDQKTVDAAKLTTGPKDDKETVAPGAIDKDANSEFKKTPSGLKYRILRNSDKKKPTAFHTVTVHYKGWLDDKTIFDSSYRRGKTTSFQLDGVIRGWTEGLQLIGEGGMIELEIPAKLGYGMRGAPPTIPPLATLHFLVELVEVK
jgi:FKBP-type peptidyl-prolyl cis-trans isomerase FkpA